MSDDDVTLGEVYRTLINYQLATANALGNLSDKVENRLVSMDLYTVAHAALQQRVLDLEQNEIRAQNYRRNLTAGVIAAVASGLGGLLVALH